MRPLGFGGSSGFGIKQDGTEVRSPLPKHCVVLVSGPDSRSTGDEELIDGSLNPMEGDSKSTTVSRARCSAARMAGMRVLYLEFDGLGTSDADDLADAIVPGLGDDDDWEVVTLDDIATPGSYWLNPPNARDDGGNKVDLEGVCRWYAERRAALQSGGSMEGAAADDIGPEQIEVGKDDVDQQEQMDEDEMARILADLDSL